MLTLCMLGNFVCFLVVYGFFFKLTFSKKSFRKTIRVSNSSDPDQARHLLGLIWVQTVCKGYHQMTKVSTSRERVKRDMKPQIIIISTLYKLLHDKIHIHVFCIVVTYETLSSEAEVSFQTLSSPLIAKINDNVKQEITLDANENLVLNTDGSEDPDNSDEAESWSWTCKVRHCLFIPVTCLTHPW